MDRILVYPGSIPLDTDILNINRNTMVALGSLTQAILGTNTIVDGLSCSPTSPASLTVTVGAWEHHPVVGGGYACVWVAASRYDRRAREAGHQPHRHRVHARSARHLRSSDQL